jgi:hypothetical protein
VSATYLIACHATDGSAQQGATLFACDATSGELSKNDNKAYAKKRFFHVEISPGEGPLNE